MKLRQLKRLGPSVPVFDAGLDRGIQADEGKTVAMSEQAAIDLLRDFPDDWQEVIEVETDSDSVTLIPVHHKSEVSDGR